LKDPELSSASPHVLVTRLLDIVAPTANIGHSPSRVETISTTCTGTAASTSAGITSGCKAVGAIGATVEAIGATVEAIVRAVRAAYRANCVAATYAAALAARCSAVVTITVTGTAKPCSAKPCSAKPCSAKPCSAKPCSTTVSATSAVSAASAVAGIREGWSRADDGHAVRE